MMDTVRMILCYARTNFVYDVNMSYFPHSQTSHLLSERLAITAPFPYNTARRAS